MKDRKPGAPVSREVGWYECRPATEKDDSVIVLVEWTSSNECFPWQGMNDGFPASAYIPLHDYPLVRGDEVRELKLNIQRLLDELNALREMYFNLRAKVRKGMVTKRDVDIMD